LNIPFLASTDYYGNFYDNLYDDEWAVSDPGTDCWYQCFGAPGKCDFCGPEGYCCSATKLDINGDCPNDIVDELTDQFAAGGGHQCIAPVGKHLPKKFNFLIFLARRLKFGTYVYFWKIKTKIKSKK